MTRARRQQLLLNLRRTITVLVSACGVPFCVALTVTLANELEQEKRHPRHFAAIFISGVQAICFYPDKVMDAPRFFHSQTRSLQSFVFRALSAVFLILCLYKRSNAMESEALQLSRMIDVVKPILKPQDWANKEVLFAQMGGAETEHAPVVGFAVDQGATIRFISKSEVGSEYADEDIMVDFPAFIRHFLA